MRWLPMIALCLLVVAVVGIGYALGATPPVSTYPAVTPKIVAGPVEYRVIIATPTPLPTEMPRPTPVRLAYQTPTPRPIVGRPAEGRVAIK